MKKTSNEAEYQITMNFAKKLLDGNIIRKEHYMKFDEIMKEKYKPTFSKLFTDLKIA